MEREKSQGLDPSKTGSSLKTAEEVKAHLENQLKQARLAAQQVGTLYTTHTQGFIFTVLGGQQTFYMPKMFEHICFRNVWSSRDRVQLPPLPQQPPPPQLALPAPQRTPARGQVRSHLEPRWSWPPNWALQFPSSKTKTSNSHLLPGSSRDRPTTVQVSQSRMRRI